VAAEADAGGARFSVDVSYCYGRWSWGDATLTPRVGLAGPDVRLELLGGRLILGGAYLSGDYAAVGATRFDDTRYHSHKNYAVEGNREDFEIDLEYRPRSTLGLVLAYKLVQYDLVSHVELESDQRHYGSGREQAVNEAWGFGVGLRPRVSLGRGRILRGEILYYPRLTAEAAGSYRYEMLFRDEGLNERWFGRTHVRGLRAAAEVCYTLQTVPVSFTVGIFTERFDDPDQAPPGWLESYLVGQTQSRVWLDDRVSGLSARAGFCF